MPQSYIGLGSNQGEPLLNLRKALELLNETQGIKVVKVSSVYLTEPVGYEDQPWFYNCVAEVETVLSPFELLEALQDIENRLGRVRTIRWGPRTIDLDVLLYEQLQIDEDDLTIPHPRMQERAFVIVPLNEIAGDMYFPNGQKLKDVNDSLTSGEKYSCILKKIW